MSEYSHIDTIWKRHPDGPQKGRIIEGEFSNPELEYLAGNTWIGTEKVDGTNIRVIYDPSSEDVLRKIEFRGRTDNAQLPPKLLRKLEDIFRPQLATFESKFADIAEVTLYGEGYGATIQKGGGNYNPNGVDFVLFDVHIKGADGWWWLKRDAIEDIAATFGIGAVPIIFEGSLFLAASMAAVGFRSYWGNFDAEGLVLKPKVDLTNRKGERVLAKIKTRDYK